MGERPEWDGEEDDHVDFWLNPPDDEEGPVDAVVALGRVIDQRRALAYVATAERLAELEDEADRLREIIAAEGATP